MTLENYILKDGQPVLEPDIVKWAQWFETSGPERTVARTKIGKGKIVSTVFLGVDHGLGSDQPVLYETMVFIGSKSIAQQRYHTRNQALEGHHLMVESYSK